MKRRIQVVICRVCSNAASVLDIDRLRQVSADAPHVGSAIVVDRACNKKTITEMVEDAKKKEADRVLIVPCPKKDISPT